MTTSQTNSKDAVVVFPIPFVHWVGDAVAATLLFLLISGISFGMISALTFGAFRASSINLIWVVPVSTMLALWIVFRFARGKVGRTWQVTPNGLERGKGWLHRIVPHQSIQLISFERSGQQMYLKVRQPRRSTTVFLHQDDLKTLFDLLRHFCPQAAAIDAEGQSHESRSLENEIPAQHALALEWRRRGRIYFLMSAASLVAFLPLTTIVALLVIPNATWTVVTILGVVWLIAATVQFGLALRAYGNARKFGYFQMKESGP